MLVVADVARLIVPSGQERPAYRQIYERLRDAILSRALEPESRLPSTRSLAGQLAVARGTVDAAYQLLAGEGYTIARGASGTFVERVGEPPAVVRAAREPPAAGARLQGGAGAPTGLLLRMGVPALDAFPRKPWARLAARIARQTTARDLDYQEPVGHGPLRRAIAHHLLVARGTACAPEHVIVTAGYQGALELLCRVLVRPGDRVWLEDPSYAASRQALALCGARLVPVPVDGQGIDVDAGRLTAPDARLAIVTPCHQFPTGATLPVARRLELLDWARAGDAWIVEDDYDSEFRYRGRPLPALKSIDTNGRVIYAGTFSKSLFPALRLGYLVVPEPLVGRFHAAFHAAPSALTQAIVAAFMDQGHFARHVRRMRLLYGERRQALLDALEHEVGGAGILSAPAGGMHIILRLAPDADDADLAARANRLDLWPAALSRCGVAAAAGPGLLMSFTNVSQPAAPAVARSLATLFERRPLGRKAASG